MKRRLPPEAIDTTGMDRVAHISTARPQARRWTELAIYFDVARQRRPFIAEVAGRTTVPGEIDRRRRRLFATASQAIRFLDSSDTHGDELARQVKAWSDTTSLWKQ